MNKLAKFLGKGYKEIIQKGVEIELGKQYLLVPDTQVVVFIENNQLFVKCPKCSRYSGEDLIFNCDDQMTHIFHTRTLSGCKCRYCVNDVSYEMGLALNSNGLKKHYTDFMKEYLSIIVETC